MRKSIWSVFALSALTVAGCAGSTEYFHPTEAVSAESTTGFAAADYDLKTANADLGEAKVWSRGAYKAEVDGQGRTVIHVALDVENNGAHPITIAARDIRLDQVTTNDALLKDVHPSNFTGAVTIPAQDERILQIAFVVPQGIKPQAVDSFRLRWSMTSQGERFAQVTPFTQDPDYVPYYAGYYYTPFYDPFYDPFWDPYVVPYAYPYRAYPYYY